MNEATPRLYKGLVSDKKGDNLCISICDFKMEKCMLTPYLLSLGLLGR
jgi:hypothetical protein